MLVSTVTGSEHGLALGTNVMLEVVRMTVNEQFRTLMPTVYLGSKATSPRPYVCWMHCGVLFGDLAHHNTSAVNGKNIFALTVSCPRALSSVPAGPWPAAHGRGQGRVSSQSLA